MPATPTTATAEILRIRYAIEPPTAEQVMQLAEATRVLGPTATMFLIQAARRFHYSGNWVEDIPLAQVAEELGMLSIGKVHKTLRRLDRFGAINLEGDTTIEISRWR